MLKNLVISALVGLTLTGSASAADFASLAKKAAAEGTVLDSGMGEYRVLERLTPNDKTVSHYAEYFSAVGGQFSGKFYIDHIEIVQENWVKEENNLWNIDQWLFAVTVDGQMVRYNHHVLKETIDGTVVAFDTPQSSDKDAQTEFSAFLSRW